jgi:hypothetical protein
MIYVSKPTRARLLRGEPTWIDRHPRASYLRAIFLATPDWVDRKHLRQIAQRATRLKLVGDHIVPLNHPLVCGLNVPWNIRLIPKLENAQRSNRWWEYTPDLFKDMPQQLDMRFR